MKKTILISLLFISSLALNAQNNDSTKTSKFKHSIGLQAGYSSAYGLSYKMDYNNWGLMTVFSPRITNNSSLYSIGLTGLRTINKEDKASMFLYLGEHIFYNSYSLDLDLNYISAFGYGMKINFSPKVYLNLQFGLAVNFYKYKYTDYYNIPRLREGTHLSPDGGIGLFYSF